MSTKGTVEHFFTNTAHGKEVIAVTDHAVFLKFTGQGKLFIRNIKRHPKTHRDRTFVGHFFQKINFCVGGP